jgi:hypothetical protein
MIMRFAMDDQSTRDLIIELKVTLEHLTKRVDDAFQRSDNRIERIEAQMRSDLREFDMRLRVIERYFWLVTGALALINILLPFIRDFIGGM